MPSNSLHSATRRSFSAALFSAVAGLVQLVILAHLVPKSELALAALAGVWVSLAAQLQEGGVNAAIVQRPQNNAAVLSTLYWFNLGLGVLLWALVAIAGSLSAIFYDVAKLAPLSIFFATTLFIGGFSTQYKALLQKNFRFQTLAQAEMTGAATSLIVSGTLAWQGWNAWAIVTGYVARQAVETIMLLMAGRALFRPLRTWQWAAASPWFQTGFSHLGERLTTHFVNQLDVLLFGKVLGTEALGVYDTFRRALFRPAVLVSGAAEQVAFPLLAKLQSRSVHLRKAYFGLLSVLSTVLFPVYVLAMLLAKPIIALVFGESWISYAPVFQWLCLSAIFAILLNPTDSLLLVKGKIRLWQGMSLLYGLLVIGALGASAGSNIAFASAALAAVQGILVALVFIKILPTMLGAQAVDYWKAIALPALFCGLAGLPLWFLEANVFGVVQFAGIVFFVVIYGLACRRWNAPVYLWLWQLLRTQTFKT